MPTEYEHLGFMKIGEALKSDIFSLSALGTLIIVVNSAEDADNLLEKRSNIYSDRFCPPMLAEPSLMNLGKLVTLLGYNDRWKKSRRLLHPLVHKQAIETFYPALGHHARLLVQRLLIRSGEAITSETLDSELYRNLAATLTESIYGYSIRTSDDSFAMSLKELAENATRACLPSNFLVNVFPMLVHVPGWMPGAGWKRAAQKWREQQESTTNAAYEWTRAQMSQGKAGNTIISSVLQHAEELGVPTDEKEDYVKQLAVTLFTAATDTTTQTLLTLIQAMLLFPEVQKKAQEEIDSVVGLDRLPSFDDKPKLEYLERLTNELLRWRPTVPSGVPHSCFEDDVYKGYRIPKGAIVFANVWAITRNTTVYPDPESFNPDRYLDPKVPIPPTFGFGRRSCPGVHYARASLFIAITTILATFDISYAKDAKGNDIVPVPESTNDLVYHPKPFKLRLVPRSEFRRKLIEAEEGEQN
ncbi:cytochrome P450 family protein [Ceratobasidium sp. AG-Ba]|nr:cytochrome P450 family protein [Ceratobasidium sp. AG-Ba]QRW14133.1 cytochrome P450 family protein [Ceratobasidium sp. AG-Ba]